MEQKTKKLRGTVLLLIAAFIWGTAFVAQSAASDNIGAFTFNATRCTLAALFLLCLLGVRAAYRKIKGLAPVKIAWKETLIGGVICGVMLCIAVNLQQFGISIYPEDTAAAGRAGFITATYVVMIAVISLIRTKHIRLTVLISIIGCLGGMYMLCLSNGFGGVYLGDLLILLCAVGYTGHVLAIDRFSHLDGIALSLVQFVTCTIISAVAMLIFEEPTWPSIQAAWLPIIYAGVLSGGVAYTLQIIGQKYAEPTVASIVMSLESVFSALAGWVLLHEHLTTIELLGCGLVFASVILAQIPMHPIGHKKHLK